VADYRYPVGIHGSSTSVVRHLGITKLVDAFNRLFDATPIKLAGIVVVCATIALVTNHMGSESFTNVILTVLGYGFGHAVGVKQAIAENGNGKA
jgi:multisubunit Na+/H+ antiporter MnhG subunit